jgi:8-oxo-dGTP pyrophosphatase MutT (NUDIX family)/hydroxymethylpyrimidine pyrophosphatase-like HAD family hydrolase
MSPIRKVGAVIVRHGRLLMVRKKGTGIFISPGGKPHAAESTIDCLRRELMEELHVGVVAHREFGTFSAKSAFDDRMIDIDVHLVDVDGFPTPGHEIEELAWIDSGYRDEGLALGSVFERFVVPRLIELGLLRPRLVRMQKSTRSMLVAAVDGGMFESVSPLEAWTHAVARRLENHGPVDILYATSRAPRNVVHSWRDLSRTADVICCDGAIAIHRGSVRQRHALAADVVEGICRIARAARSEFVLEFGDRFAVSAPDIPWLDPQRYPPAQAERLDRRSRQWSDVVKIVLSPHASNDVLEACVREFGGRFGCARDSTGALDVSPPGVNRLTALLECCERDRVRLITVGSGPGDFELLCEADEAFVCGDGLASIRWPGHVRRVERPSDIVDRLSERAVCAD